MDIVTTLRRFALQLGTRLVKFGLGGSNRAVSTAHVYRERVQQEIQHYETVEQVHDLPEIFHFWSNRYVRPKLEAVFEVSGFDDLYAKYIQRYGKDHPGETVEVFSLGAGNADTEVRIAQKLRSGGFTDFQFHCLDLNPEMLRRGRELAASCQLADRFEFVEVDLAKWRPNRAVAVVMAHHSLHHMVELEEIFQRVKEAIGSTGYFVTTDMIGRNGHMRWPEALAIVQEIWKTMPERYRYNHQLGRLEEKYENWDCSKEGFEGIRSQDILPLLLKTFHFEAFAAYGNLPEVFVDRGFGPNFDIRNPEDTAFVDRIGALNDRLIDEGAIKPTQMAAVMRAVPVASPRCYQHWTPEFCVRPVDANRTG